MPRGRPKGSKNKDVSLQSKVQLPQASVQPTTGGTLTVVVGNTLTVGLDIKSKSIHVKQGNKLVKAITFEELLQDMLENTNCSMKNIKALELEFSKYTQMLNSFTRDFTKEEIDEDNY